MTNCFYCTPKTLVTFRSTRSSLGVFGLGPGDKTIFIVGHDEIDCNDVAIYWLKTRDKIIGLKCSTLLENHLGLCQNVYLNIFKAPSDPVWLYWQSVPYIEHWAWRWSMQFPLSGAHWPCPVWIKEILLLYFLFLFSFFFSFLSFTLLHFHPLKRKIIRVI